jgi:hypothetical protein
MMVTTGSRYDVSACDMLDTETDYVLHERNLNSAQTTIPVWIYRVCVLVVYLVRCLSHFILASINESGQSNDENSNKTGTDNTVSPKVNTPLCLTACGVCTVLSIFQGDHVFVTHEDLVFHWFSVFYIVPVAYAGLFSGTT